MRVSEMEEVVTTVKSILKTLECPICFEFLKIPVSAGCGHFFCKECVSGILQSTYRAPCPLCKRSFTRRSVQEAAQRQSVIAAAKALANTCASLTGVKFFTEDSIVKAGRKSVDDASTPPKKLKSSTPPKELKSSNIKSQELSEKELTKTRKRKSCENDDNAENLPDEIVLFSEVDDCGKEKKKSSLNKRACPDSDDDDDDLPTLSEILSQSAQNTPKKETLGEPNLTVKTTDKALAFKTYSHKKPEKAKTNEPFDLLIKDSLPKVPRVSSLENDRGPASNKTFDKSELKNASSVEESKLIELKNKMNALKNKTNEGESDQHIKAVRSLNLKQKHLKNKKKVSETESEGKLKENEQCSSPTVQSSNKKLGRPKRSSTKLQISNPTVLGCRLMISDADLEEIKKPPVSKNACKTSGTISTVQCEKERTMNKSVEVDHFKSLGLTDTAVSVGAVSSPLVASKIPSLHKSPGWSRVKEVKKDFRLKKFASLHVEKNSPNVSLKSASVSAEEEPGSKPGSSFSGPSIASKLLDSDDIAKEKGEKAVDSCQIKNLLIREEVCSSTKAARVTENVDKSSRCSEIPEDIDDSISTEQGDDASNTDEVPNVNNLKMNLGKAESKMVMNSVPSVSITSNSLICAKYSDASDKISRQNIMKAQKIIYEVQNVSSVGNQSLNAKNENFVSAYVPPDNNQRYPLSGGKNEMFPCTAEFRPTSVPTHLSDYQSLYSHSACNNEFQYVEQSQQTSQVFDFHKAVCDNLRIVKVPEPQSNFCHPPERTKVVKRTCLTLEEIQDCFLKCNQSGSSETICTLPFLSGMFKLHIGVSDETLNVSVLQVIDPSSENNAVQKNASLLSDKCIQASNSLFVSSAVVPSSNPTSDCSQPEASDPFPYLKKQLSNQKNLSPSTMVGPADIMLVEPVQNENDSAIQYESALQEGEDSTRKENAPIEMFDYSEPEEDCMSKHQDLNISEIIHFTPKLHEIPKEPEEIQEASSSHGHFLQEKFSVFSKAHENNVTVSKGIAAFRTDSLPNAISMECDLPDGKIDSAIKDVPTKVQEAEHMDMDDANSDREESLKNSQVCITKEQANQGEKYLPADKMDSVISDAPCKVNTTPEKEQIDSDEEESLQKLQECFSKRQATQGRNQSRLSLKQKSTRSRIRTLESSDESERDVSLSEERFAKGVESQVPASKSPKAVKLAPEILVLPKAKSLNNAGPDSVAAEMPSTLNSMLSEDASEMNATEIMLEIEELSDKIKILEEKLKEAGSEESKKCKSPVPEEIEDSEDSTDLFPQSVPPTPPKHI